MATAGLLVLLVCAVYLALPGDFHKVGVVETPALPVAIPATPGWGRCRRLVMRILGAGGPLPA
jgi:hypothetical protein